VERPTRIAGWYACALVSVFFLLLPPRGYGWMMETKYAAFLLLTTLYLAAALADGLARARGGAPRKPLASPRMTAPARCAAAYLACSAVSALLSPYGAQTLLGGPRRDGLVTLSLCVAVFFLLARDLRPDRRLLYLAAGAATLCDALVLAQLTGRNPLRLYPGNWNYYDGDVSYAGFYAGTAGNIDFTAFLLALAVCVLLFALARLRLWTLAPTAALTLYVLYRLGVAAAWVGLACALVWGLPLLFPGNRKRMAALSAVLTLGAVVLLWRYGGENRTLAEAAALLHGEADGGFGSGRVAIWRECWELARERPLFGGGPDTLWLRGVEPLTWFRNGTATPVDITAAHNEYLNILVNQGAFALCAYLALLGSALLRCFRRAREPAFALCGAGLLCYAAMAPFSISTCITAPYVWLLLALAAQREQFVET